MPRPRTDFDLVRSRRKARSAGVAGCLYGLPETRQPVICPAAFPPPAPRKERSPMDSFEVNKILGAVLFTCLVLLALNIAAGALFTPEPPKKPSYEIAAQEEAGAAPAAAPAGDEPIEQALANADPKRGQQAAPQGQPAPGAKPSPPRGEAQSQVPGPAQPQATAPGQSQAPQPGSPPSPAPGQKSA